MPALRPGPPYLMTEMIAAEPALAARVAHRLATDPSAAALVAAITGAIGRGEPVTTTGCGTSEHAAMGAAELFADAIDPEAAHLIRSRQALDLVRQPQDHGLVIAISHEGGTWATNEAIASGRRAGARTALVTVSRRSPGAAAAELVVETGEQDQSWCHTVGYLSPLVVAAALAGILRGELIDPVALRALVAVAADQGGTATDAAAALSGCRRLIITGSGIDLVSARELALKIEEGARLPAIALHTETIRHGHLAAAGPETGLVHILTDADPQAEVVRERAQADLRSAQALGMPALAILGPRIGVQVPLELTPAGRLMAPEANRIWPLAEAALGSAIPLQLLAERLAIVRGRNPDTIGRDDPRQAAAADA